MVNKHFLIFAALLVILALSTWPDHVAGEEDDQLNFASNKNRESPSVAHPNLVFASFAGLLQQWPNTYAYSGHSIVAGVIPRGTLLYHGTNLRSPPPTQGLEWLAFNPEYSYIIHSRRLGQLDLHTYVSSRPLRIIYLDGQSSSLGTPGFMDSQSVLITGTVPQHFGDHGRYIDADYARARELCKIGAESGFEGVVRMNTCFELLWCDFADGLELLGSTNTTDPFDTQFVPEEVSESAKLAHEAHGTNLSSGSSATLFENHTDFVTNPLSPHEMETKFQQRIEISMANESAVRAASERGSSGDENPQESLLQVIERPRVLNSPFYLRGAQYYFRAASRQFFMPGEVRVVLDPSSFVSFYDGIESLSEKRRVDGTEHGPRHAHTLYGISAPDAQKIKDRLFRVLARKNAEGWSVQSDRLDWRASVWTIIQTYTNPLRELEYLLKRDDGLTNIKRAAEVRGLTYNMLLPYLDFSAWDVRDPAWRDHSIKRCATGFTSGTYRAEDLAESILLIIGAIEGTLERLCASMLAIFTSTIELSIPSDPFIIHDEALESAAQSRVAEWREQTEDLMKWLGWSTWGHCDPPCKPNELCLPPLWPLFWMKGRPEIHENQPVCSDASWEAIHK